MTVGANPLFDITTQHTERFPMKVSELVFPLTHTVDLYGPNWASEEEIKTFFRLLLSAEDPITNIEFDTQNSSDPTQHIWLGRITFNSSAELFVFCVWYMPDTITIEAELDKVKGSDEIWINCLADDGSHVVELNLYPINN